MSIFESKKTRKYREEAWKRKAIAEVMLGDFKMVKRSLATGKTTKEEAYDFLEGTGSWLEEKLDELKKEYDD